MNHESNRGKVGRQLVQKLSRYTEVINLRIPHRGTASLAQVSTMGLCPLLVEPFGTGCDTHTHTLQAFKTVWSTLATWKIPNPKAF